MKKCKVCLLEKDFDDYYKNCLLCKKCRCKQTSEWRKNNKEKASKARSLRRKNNLELYRNKDKEYRKKNLKRENLKAKLWRENNREKSREAVKKWKLNNPEKIYKWKEENRERIINYVYKWRDNNKEKYKELSRNSVKLQRLKSPEKNRARKIFWCAVRVGHIIRPTNCSNCLVDCKPDGHHEDYNKPLEVIWLCKKCHVKVHMNLKKQM